MYKKILLILIITLSINLKAENSFAQIRKQTVPIGYTPFEFSLITGDNQVSQMKKLWANLYNSVQPQLRPKVKFYAYQSNRGNGKIDVITMIYSPELCSMHSCPLRIITMEAGKPRILLDISSFFVVGAKAYALGPYENGENRNLLISTPQGMSIWSFNKNKNTYVREEK